MKIVLCFVVSMAMGLFALPPTSHATPPAGGFHSGGLAAPRPMGQTAVHIAQAPAGRVQVPRVQVVVVVVDNNFNNFTTLDNDGVDLTIYFRV